jgi:hypothetical protein
MTRWRQIMLVIMFRSLSLISPKHFYIIWLSNISNIECTWWRLFTKRAVCTIFISTLLFNGYLKQLTPKFNWLLYMDSCVIWLCRSLFVFNCVRWQVFFFVIDIGGIVDHHRLKLSFHKRIELWYYTRKRDCCCFI